MGKALAGIPGMFPCADDVKVQGSSKERHDINLLETISKARVAGIKFNPDKCHIKKQKIMYFRQIRWRRTMPQKGESHLEATVTNQQARAAEFSWNGEFHVHIHTYLVPEDTHDARSPEEGCTLRVDQWHATGIWECQAGHCKRSTAHPLWPEQTSCHWNRCCTQRPRSCTYPRRKTCKIPQQVTHTNRNRLLEHRKRAAHCSLCLWETTYLHFWMQRHHPRRLQSIGVHQSEASQPRTPSLATDVAQTADILSNAVAY